MQDSYSPSTLEGDWPSYPIFKTELVPRPNGGGSIPSPNHDIPLLRLWDFNRCIRATTRVSVVG